MFLQTLLLRLSFTVEEDLLLDYKLQLCFFMSYHFFYLLPYGALKALQFCKNVYICAVNFAFAQ